MHIPLPAACSNAVNALLQAIGCTECQLATGVFTGLLLLALVRLALNQLQALKVPLVVVATTEGEG